MLTIKGRLDREQQSEYRLQVHAVDGGGRSCTTDVLISIKDVNDNAPQFSNSVYKVSIPEDAKINTLITRLSAIDKDAGQYCFHLLTSCQNNQSNFPIS